MKAVKVLCRMLATFMLGLAARLYTLGKFLMSMLFSLVAIALATAAVI